MSQFSLIEHARKQMDIEPNTAGWHATITGLLEAAPAGDALWRPPGGGHTIYELAVHLAYSLEEIASRLKGSPGGWDEERSWVQAPKTLSEQDWNEVKARLYSAREQFIAIVSSFTVEQLMASRGERPSVAETVLQMLHHESFHAGQIAILRRQQGKAALI
jgi:uncharacterized damage-inducible protein DinB